MIVLDTDVVSELIKVVADEAVVSWLDRLETTALRITAVTACELRHGVELMPPGRRRDELGRAVEDVILDDFEDAVLPLDRDSSPYLAQLSAARHRSGRPIGTNDAYIAAICLQWGATLATRDASGFAGTGVELVNPWTA